MRRLLNNFQLMELYTIYTPEIEDFTFEDSMDMTPEELTERFNKVILPVID